MKLKSVEVNLSEEDWNFVASEVERFKREEDAVVTEDQVLSTLVETGMCRESAINGKYLSPEEIRLLKMLRVRTGYNASRTYDALASIGAQISHSAAGAEIIKHALSGICTCCDKPVVDGDVTCAEHAV